MTPEELELRRERVVLRALTRAVQTPTPAHLELVDFLQGCPGWYFDTDRVEIIPGPWTVDGVRTGSQAAAESLLQDRYGLDEHEARKFVRDTRERGL